VSPCRRGSIWRRRGPAAPKPGGDGHAPRPRHGAARRRVRLRGVAVLRRAHQRRMRHGDAGGSKRVEISSSASLSGSALTQVIVDRGPAFSGEPPRVRWDPSHRDQQRRPISRARSGKQTPPFCEPIAAPRRGSNPRPSALAGFGRLGTSKSIPVVVAKTSHTTAHRNHVRQSKPIRHQLQPAVNRWRHQSRLTCSAGLPQAFLRSAGKETLGHILS